MSDKPLSYAEETRLKYDPEKVASAPPGGFASAAEAAQAAAAAGLPQPVPWPEALIPTAQPLTPAPAETDSLVRFAGYDAVVMTYTSAEAASLAALFTPEHRVSTWYEYRHGIDDYIPIVTGPKAPFNSTEREDQRYYHSLGLYFPCMIGKAKVLLIKSGLHMDYDTKTLAPNGVVPFYKLVSEIVQTIKPKMFITTGTGGGIGSQVKLGDVIVAAHTRFDCTEQFKSQSWATESYKTSPVPASAPALITPELTKPNAQHIATATPIAGRSVPKIWSSDSTIVTTDIFAFDTSNNYFKLQTLGQVCDMGDAMVGRALANFTDVEWYAIRNASDPQVPMNGTTAQDYKIADTEAGDIYKKYGGYTTAASVVAAWAIMASSSTAGGHPKKH
jgi:nucleoside phosphorylase